MLEGVPHHASGCWQPSKKLAQRDAAERALALFAGAWGGGAWSIPAKHSNPVVDPDEVLRDFCHGVLPSWWTSPALGHAADIEVTWKELPYHSTSPHQESGGFRSYVELTIFGVPHMIGGTTCATPEEARRETARRVLWYLGCPGFETFFTPGLLPEEEPRIPLPPAMWATLGAAAAEGPSFESADLRRQSIPTDITKEDSGSGRRMLAGLGPRSPAAPNGNPEEGGIRPNLIMGTGRRRLSSPSQRVKHGQVYLGSLFGNASRGPIQEASLANGDYANGIADTFSKKISDGQSRPAESAIDPFAIGG